MPETQPVDEVRDAAAEHEAHSHGQERMTPCGAREEHDQGRDCDRRQGDDDAGRVREEPERDPGVADAVDRERAEHPDGVSELERTGDDELRHLVGRGRGAGDDDQRRPLRRSRGEGAPRARDGLERVRRRADANLQRSLRRNDPCRLAHSRSSSCLHERHSVA